MILYLALCLVDIADGSTGSISLLGPLFKKKFHMTDTEQEIMSSVYYLGAFIGTLFSGNLAEKIGRKPIILFGMIM